MKIFTRLNGQGIENAKQSQKQVLNVNELVQIKGGTDNGGGMIRD